MCKVLLESLLNGAMLNRKLMLNRKMLQIIKWASNIVGRYLTESLSNGVMSQIK